MEKQVRIKGCKTVWQLKARKPWEEGPCQKVDSVCDDGNAQHKRNLQEILELGRAEYLLRTRVPVTPVAKDSSCTALHWPRRLLKRWEATSSPILGAWRKKLPVGLGGG